jgi:Flp pilus assembly protein TadD
MPADRLAIKKWLIALALIALTATAYWEIRDHSFVSYDDDVYVVANAQVQKGLTWQGVGWAFKSTSAANWHPLTWLSHMLDVQLFGLNPAGHHLTSLFIHIANVVVLYLLLEAVTGALWSSALVAALFAVHPINVESVAWIAERKNVLSTLFWLLTMWAYVRYASRPATSRYFPVVVSFALALMCKPMVVTLPLALLLLDYWPLSRLRKSSNKDKEPIITKRRAREVESKPSYPARSIRQLVIEKVPLIVLAIFSSVMTVKAQRGGGAVGTTEVFPVLIRFENAAVSYARYLLDVVWPLRLAVFYPHPRAALSLWQVVTSTLVLIAISSFVVLRARLYAYLTTGWLWYLGTLVPVIGLVQVGLQSRADRYAYVPLIGIFIAIVWLAQHWAKDHEIRKKSLTIVAACILIALTIGTRVQAGYWQNSVVLFQRAVDVTSNNYVAHNNLGELLAQQGRLDEAAIHFTKALDINPSFAHARHNMGMIFVQRGNLDEAIQEFQKAIELEPTFADAYNKLGAALASRGRLDEAIASFSKAIEINPAYGSAHANLGSAYEQQGRLTEAIAEYALAIQSTADTTMAAQTHFKLGRLLARTGKRREAAENFKEALRLKPDFAQAQQALNGITQGNGLVPDR